MHSIQAKTTLLTVCAIVVAMTVATLIGVIAIKNVGDSSSEEMLLLLCQTGEKNLDYYFESVEQSVEMVSTYVKSDIESIEMDDFAAHIQRARGIFAKTANKTNGVLTYYYRIDPAVSTTDKGFWYIATEGDSADEDRFVEHEVTDITLYDTEDTSALVWFTVPKATGKPIWLPAYITDNLDVRVISYNVPIYRYGTFIGVVGIEIDYTTLAEQVDSIKLFTNGYAFINDAEGNLVYHPRVDVLSAADGNQLKVPDGLLADSTFITYEYEGVKKQGVSLPLHNGMRLTVAVPIAEINESWHRLVLEVVIAAAVLLVVFIVLTIFFTRHFTKPLRKLTEAAEQINNNNYDVNLDYHDNDEIGLLTKTVNRLVQHLRGYIGDLNSLAYGDALTSVRNKGAFDIFVREMQARIDDPNEHPEFAIGIFDCDDLKMMNDQYGHDKGDMFLKNSSHLICRVFQYSPVFRVGGDEFAVVLQNDDYRNRRALTRYFVDKSAEICAFAKEPWEQIRVAVGVADYNPKLDRSVEDVIRRADHLMYDNKRARKA